MNIEIYKKERKYNKPSRKKERKKDDRRKIEEREKLGKEKEILVNQRIRINSRISENKLIYREQSTVYIKTNNTYLPINTRKEFFMNRNQSKEFCSHAFALSYSILHFNFFSFCLLFSLSRFPLLVISLFLHYILLPTIPLLVSTYYYQPFLSWSLFSYFCSAPLSLSLPLSPLLSVI
jgi:hypothetical protein